MRIFLLLVFTLFLPIESAQSQIHKSDDPVKKESKKSLQESDDKHKVPFLGSMFSADSIPSADIPVLANSLGDVVQDSVVNLLDLLRLRDITIGRPPSPTSYELDESDLNFDGNVNQTDLSLIRDILLRKKGVPHLIDETGGKVLGNGITLTIPPGGVDETVVMSIKRNSESEFSARWGVDTEIALQDSAYFMSSFEIKSSTADFKLPVGASIKLDSMPPCAYEGLNGLFATVPDRDGDGLSDLFLINKLEVAGDSLTLNAADIPVPTIQSLSVSQIEPGQSLIITGTGFGNRAQDIIILLRQTSTDSSWNTIPSFVNDSTIIITAPGVTPGQFTVTVLNILTGLISNSQIIDILPYAALSGDIRSIIVNFYISLAAEMDSLDTDSLFAPIEDPNVRDYFASLRQSNRASIDSFIVSFIALEDSILDGYSSVAAFIENLTNGSEAIKHTSGMQASGLTNSDICDRWQKEHDRLNKQLTAHKNGYEENALLCLKYKESHNCFECEQANTHRELALETTWQIAALGNLWRDCICRDNPNDQGCDKCPETTYIGWGPKGEVSGGYDPDGNFGAVGTCINIIDYRGNECCAFPSRIDLFPPVPLVQPPQLQCTEPDPPPLLKKLGGTLSTDILPHPGSIIKVTNVPPVVYNIVGIVNDNGHAFIPNVPLNTQVTYSMYDPVTGFYDPDVGTYTTTSEPGGFDRPILLFQPNTDIRNKTLRIGEPENDLVSLDMQRIDYLLNIDDTDTLKLFNIGFSASAHLSLKIDDPEGNLIFDNTDLACILMPHHQFNKVGKYLIRVALGISGQTGSFELGVGYSPGPPIESTCLCGTVLIDTLFFEISPYTVTCLADIPINDTLTVEAGVTLQFEPGGVLTANGTLSGVGTSEKPIKLKQVGAPQQENVAIKKPVYGRREVQP